MTNSKVSVVNKLVDSAKGKIFSVVFVKADGSDRKMVCRRGVEIHSNGGKAGYESNPDNIGVYEMMGEGGKEHYRCFNANRVKSLKVNGVEHNFDLEG